MRRQQAAMAEYQANLDAMNEEFVQESIKDQFNPDDPDAVQLHEEFWTDRELLELDFVQKQIAELSAHLNKMKYEIENYFTVFDWLKVYSHSILEDKVDMNEMLRSVASGSGQAFDGET